MQSVSVPVQLSTRSSLSALTAALELFRELRPEMAIQLPLVFLIVAQHKGISSARLCQLTGLSQSAMSRNLTALSKEGKKGEPGLGLVVKTIDTNNPRAHAIHLTRKGKAMAARLAEAVGKAAKLRRGVEVKLGWAEQDAALMAAKTQPEAFAGAHWEVWMD